MAVLKFRRRRSTSSGSRDSSKISPPRRELWPAASTRLAGKLQQLALDDPNALLVLERIVDKWIQQWKGAMR